MQQMTSDVQKWVISFLGLAGALAAIAAVQLYFGATLTEKYFSWTVNPPIAAAFIGAHFFAVVIMAIAAVRAKSKAHARYFLPTVFVFASVMLAATLLSFDKFHFSSPLMTARAAAWAWIIVYFAVPIVGLVALIKEKAYTISSVKTTMPLPQWMKMFLLLYAFLFFVVGVIVFVAPVYAESFFPWTVTVLVARASAAMLIALGVTAYTLVRENTKQVIAAPLIGFLLLACLHFIALVRFPDQVVMGTVYTDYLIVIISMIIFSGGALLSLRKNNLK